MLCFLSRTCLSGPAKLKIDDAGRQLAFLRARLRYWNQEHIASIPSSSMSLYRNCPLSGAFKHLAIMTNGPRSASTNEVKGWKPCKEGNRRYEAILI
jgi:hypothetical protein